MCTGKTRGSPNIQISQTCNNNKINAQEKYLEYEKKHIFKYLTILKNIIHAMPNLQIMQMWRI